MGASKEGTMSVRDKINLVLSNFISEEDDDPPDTSESGAVKRNPVLTSTAVVSPEVGSSTPAHCLSLDSPSRGSISGINSVKVAFSPKLGEPSSQLASMSPNVKTGGSESSGPGNSFSNHNQPPVSDYDGQVPEGTTNQYLFFQKLLARQLRLIESLQKRLSMEESSSAGLRKERDQTVLLNLHLQQTLDGERKLNAEIRIQSDAANKVKDERIAELEKELAKAKARKPVDHKGTCITPPPTHSTLKRIWVDEGQVCETKHNLYIDPPLHKRAKLGVGQSERSPNCLAQTKPKVFLSPSSYLSPRGHLPIQSDSPPQLSPAVTPKSALNTSGRPREIGSFLGEDVNDDSFVGPPDEFQDELEHINRKSFSTNTQEGVNMRPPDAVYEQQYSSYSPHAQQSGSSGDSASGSFAFIRPPTVKSRHARFMFPEGKRRFMNHGSSFLPVNKSNLYQYPGPSSDILKPKSNKNMMPSKHSLQQHSGIRNRSNNFLNLSRPLTKKAPVVVYPPPQTTPSSASHFRSLDGAAALASDPCSSLHGKTSMGPSTPPPVTVKKRKVGRPPGSGLKSKHYQGVRLSSFYTSPPGTSTSPHGGQLLNGSISTPEPPCPPPPQRFSQRGRLLKPNRQRYSPDPDASLNVREKFLTTKRGYFVGEPFVHTGYAGEEEETGLSHDDDGLQLPPSLPGEIDSEIELPQPDKQISKSTNELFEDGEVSVGSAIPVSFVEVPKWRIIPVENLSDSDDRHSLDDMSDEAFLKRHQKLEAKEKQRKRWDSQRMREESYLERLKRKQEERERQKELRRQQRKRNKGRNGASEEETVTPNVEEIKAIHIGAELPVGAFGHPLPLVEKVDFKLVWNVPPSVAPQTPVVTPPPQVENTVVLDTESCVSDDSDSKGDIENPVTPIIDFCEESSCVPSPLSSAIQPPSSPSSSSLSLPSIPSPGASPPPPIIFPACDEFDSDDHSKDAVDSISSVTNSVSTDDCETDTSATTVNKSDEVEPVQKECEESPECKFTEASSPVFSVDLVDYVDESANSKDAVPSAPDSGGETCDISSKPNLDVPPSISIPLQTPPLATSSTPPPCESNSHSSVPHSTGNKHPKDLRPRNSTVVRFPQVICFPPSSTLASTLSSSSLSLSSQPSSSVSKTSITFFIPNNPLAPRQHRPANSGTAASSATNKKSSSSVLSPLAPPTRSECCKDS